MDVAEARVEVEPGGNPAGDPDLDAPGCGLRDERAAVDAPDADAAVGGLGADRSVRVLDVDVAVRRLDPEVAADLADPGIAVGALDHRRAVDFADADIARGSRQLGVSGHLLERDVAGR